MHASHQVRCWACPGATWCSTTCLVGCKQNWVAELQPLHQCLRPQYLFFDKHDSRLCFHACRRTYPKAPNVVSHVSITIFDLLRVLPFCQILSVPDVCAILKIQTYRIKFFDNLHLNEFLNLSHKCAVVKDEKASVREHNCNVALSVKELCSR